MPGGPGQGTAAGARRGGAGPEARRTAHDTLQRLAAGGTSVAADDGRIVLRWALAVAALAAGGAVAYFMTRGKREAAVPEDDAAEAAEVEPAAGAAAAPADEPEQRPAGNAAAAEPSPQAGRPGRAAAARALSAALQTQRLWSTVEVDAVDDSLLIVTSSYCEDSGLAAAVDEARPRLSAAGLTVLRCVAQHGSVVFERRL